MTVNGSVREYVTVRYTAQLTGGEVVSWESHQPEQIALSDDGPGNYLLSAKFAQFGLVANGRFYPPHRVRHISWEPLSLDDPEVT